MLRVSLSFVIEVSRNLHVYARLRNVSQASIARDVIN